MAKNRKLFCHPILVVLTDKLIKFKQVIKLKWLTCVFLLSIRLADAAFLDQFTGARALGMSGAVSAVANRADGVIVNPATLINISSRQLTATTARLHVGLKDRSQLVQHVLAYGYSSEDPIREKTRESIGVLLKRLSADAPRRLLYSETLLVIGGAKEFSWGSAEVGQLEKKLVLGVSAKVLNWDTAPTIGANETIIQNLPGRTQLGVDIGGLFRPSPNVPIAFCVQNVNRPDIASRRPSSENGVSDSTQSVYLDRIVSIGIGVVGQQTVWDMDLQFRPNEVDVRVGIEYWLTEQKTAVRFGFRLENLAWGTNLTLGSSYHPTDNFTLDYGFIYPVSGIAETLGSHRFSIVYDY